MAANYIIGVLLVALISYLLGSINFAIILSGRFKSDDIRKHGSGNAGMTNMLRVYGKKTAVLTAAGDFLKGVAAILISRYLIFPLLGITTFDAGYIAGFFVLMGHIFPVYFGFKGGKGVMTSLGIMFILDPAVFAVALAVGLIGIFITRMVSVGSILGAICLPIVTLIYRKAQNRPFLYDTLGCLVIAIVVIFMHRSNIKRILTGKENKFGKK